MQSFNDLVTLTESESSLSMTVHIYLSYELTTKLSSVNTVSSLTVSVTVSNKVSVILEKSLKNPSHIIINYNHNEVAL